MTEHVAIVLAAGQGTRMESELPKVLVPVLDRPMVRYVVDTLRSVETSRILLVVGYRGELVRQEFDGEEDIEFVEQKEQLGTGHAVMVCRDQLLGHQGATLVLTGDSPLCQASSLKKILAKYEESLPACILGTAHKSDPTGLGRIFRSERGEFLGIVEERDATQEQKQITEVNMSTYLFRTPALLASLERLTTDNAQREYYVTDCPSILKEMGEQVLAEPVLEPCEALSINNMHELGIVEQEMRALGWGQPERTKA